MTKAVHMNKNNWVGVYDSYYRTLFLEAVPVRIYTSMPFLLHVRFQNSFKERQICKKKTKTQRKAQKCIHNFKIDKKRKHICLLLYLCLFCVFNLKLHAKNCLLPNYTTICNKTIIQINVLWRYVSVFIGREDTGMLEIMEWEYLESRQSSLDSSLSELYVWTI